MSSSPFGNVTDPAGNAVTLVTTSTGMLTDLYDRNGGHHVYGYGAYGRLASDTNAVGSTQLLTRTETEDGFEVTRTSQMGRVSTHSAELTAGGGMLRKNTGPDGTWAESVFYDERITVALSDGTDLDIELSPDPRWGMSAPLADLELVTPLGRYFDMRHTRSVVLDDPNDLTSVSSQLDTLTVNGPVYIAIPWPQPNGSGCSKHVD